MKKISTLYRCTGRSFTKLHTETKTAVATSKKTGKTDPLEIERARNIRKPLTLFY